MKRYRIVKTIMLGFLTPQDQYDDIIDPESGVVLESDGHTIWAVKNEKRKESITVGYAIDHWLKMGLIEEF